MSTQPEQPASTIYNRAVVLKPVGEHKRTVFFLHGLGDEGQSFIDVFQMLALKNTKIILPNAPRIPITCNGKYVMPGWYDIVSLGDDREFGKNEDVEGINKTVAQLEIAINHEAALVGGHQNVIIGGFSQGSAITQLTAARLKNKLGGVVALSGYALLSAESEEGNPINTKDTPYFIYHGKDDEVVSINYSRNSKAYWEKKGLSNIEYTEEPGLGHSLSRDEIVKVKAFFTKVGFV